MQVKRNRNFTGAAMAEQPAVMWLIFIGLFFPFLCIATLGLRYTYLMVATKEAVLQAALAKTFSANASSTDLSAVNAANSTASSVISRFEGVTVNSIRTEIVISDTTNSTIQITNAKLSAPADSSRNLYLLQTTLEGQIQPLAQTQSSPWIRVVPGITAPWTVRVSARRVAENPQGLNI